MYGCPDRKSDKVIADHLTALRTALKRLGYTDCYHMMSASVENPPDCLMWMDALTAKYDGVGTFGREQWDQLLGHCQVGILRPTSGFEDIDVDHRQFAIGRPSHFARNSLRPIPMPK